MIRRILGGIVFGCVVCFWLAIIALGVLLVIVTRSNAHDHGPGSWINEQRLTDPVTGQWCCSLIDCQEESDNVQAVDGGFRIISTGEFIETKRVIWKSPGGFWRCRNLGDNTTRCLIGPPQGS